MNIHSMLVLECNRDNRYYNFAIPMGASYADAKDVMQQMIKQIENMEKMAEEQAAKAKEEKAQEDCADKECENA